MIDYPPDTPAYEARVNRVSSQAGLATYTHRIGD